MTLSFPPKFRPKLEEIRQGLPLLFRPGYPTTIQHKDLMGANIHVDSDTGCITGIIDWVDINAIYAPFGVSPCGLETWDCWIFHPSHVDLRDHFWETLYAEIGPISEDNRRSIKIAWSFGLFAHFACLRKDYLCLGTAGISFLDINFVCETRQNHYHQREQYTSIGVLIDNISVVDT
ncbi:hypothetical protein F4818DRAFT_328010 [Hypoxylon cercidicola]|nr:hypothetical protein F4818DRAFT_328010 [Hypoxylon cercidicola]